MLGERFKLNGNSFLALLFFASLTLGDETRIVLLGILAATVLHILRHGFLVELSVIAHHTLSILNHSGKHGCQSVTFILVKAGKFSKAKDTTMLSLAIFVDVRLRETVVIICDCRTILPDRDISLPWIYTFREQRYTQFFNCRNGRV